MQTNTILGTGQEFVPVCHSPFFRTLGLDVYIQVQSCKSFQKSKQKKLKLIKDSKSLQKALGQKQEKRKIRPMKMNLPENSHDKSAKRTKKTLCSIKEYKQKISRITNDSIVKNETILKTQNTDISQDTNNFVRTLEQSEQQKPLKLASLLTMNSLNQVPQSLPTLNNSLQIKQDGFNAQSLLHSARVSFHKSSSRSHFSIPTNNYFETPHEPIEQFSTPVKDKIFYQENENNKTTRQKEGKKQKLSLNMARNVQTFQTLKTQNDPNCSFIEDGQQYHNVFNKIADPDYFQLKRQNMVFSNQ